MKYNWDALFSKLRKPSIRLEFCEQSYDMLPIGSSRFGGAPDLPTDFIWPTFAGVGFNGSVKERPLAFLLQIRCEDIAALDKDSQLPESGLLSFFYELESMHWGCDAADRGCARVYYFDGQTELALSQFPPDLSESCYFPIMPLQFFDMDTLPDSAEFQMEYEEILDFTQYEKQKNAQGYTQNGVSRLLGHADIVQSPMKLQCELVTRGEFCMDALSCDLPFDEMKAVCQAATQWKLLLQLDSTDCGELSLMFGEFSMYFYIRQKDLTSRRFENAWMVLQYG